MDFLKRAERYAEARGDEDYFRHYYTLYRLQYSVAFSVERALTYLYDDDVVRLLKYQ